MARLSPGDTAPEFTLGSNDGPVSLGDFSGSVVVVYFYPKDDTSGCTAQACEFRDLKPEFDAAGATVLGISPDTLKRHDRFRAKHGLNFRLLSDPDHTVSEAYGVWVEKSMYGKTYMGIERSTFVVGPDGRLRDVRYKVTAKGSAQAVLAHAER